MNTALWIVAVLLAVAYTASGGIKLFASRERLLEAPGGGWIEDFSQASVRAIGVLEVAGAVGLTLPAILDVAPILVPLAAVGIAMLMVGAVITRLRRREHRSWPLVADVTYFALACFVAWGRFGPERFPT